MTRAAVAMLAVLPLAVASGCSDDFPPYSRLDALRILAIRAEPVAPGPDQTSHLDALVYLPPDQRADPAAAVYSWSWCPFPGSADSGYPCLVTEDQVTAIAGQTVSFDLGSTATADLPLPLMDPSFWQRACQGLPGFPLPSSCDQGFPVLVKLTVTTPTDQVTGIRTVRLRFRDDQAANANPTITGLFAVSAGATEEFYPDAPPILPRGQSTPIGAAVDPSQAETYLQVDAQGVSSTQRERLILSWFVETGNLKFERTEFIDGSTALDAALTNAWQPFRASFYPPDTADLFVVLRDDRDGISWMQGVASLRASP